MPKKNKRLSRIFALQMLFSMEIIHGKIEQNLCVSMAFHEKAETEIKEYAEFLARGVAENISQIDEIISTYCRHWDITRLAMVDLNILRIGVFELISCPDTPSAVIINEAIEIARRYGSEDSPGFINGILDSVRKKVRMVEDDDR